MLLSSVTKKTDLIIEVADMAADMEVDKVANMKVD